MGGLQRVAILRVRVDSTRATEWSRLTHVVRLLRAGSISRSHFMRSREMLGRKEMRGSGRRDEEEEMGEQKKERMTAGRCG